MKPVQKQEGAQDYEFAPAFDSSLFATAVTVNRTHNVIYANPAFCKMVNNTAEELSGVAITKNTPLTKQTISVFNHVYESGKSEVFTEPQSADRPVYGYCSVSPHFDAENNVAGIILQVMESSELTQKRQLLMEANQQLLLNALRQLDKESTLNAHLTEEVLEHKHARDELALSRLNLQDAQSADSAKSIFLANMSHEIRTPLSTIIGYAEMIEEDAQTNNFETLNTSLEIIRLTARHMVQIINNILDLAKVESGKMDTQMSEFDADEMIRDVAAQAKPLATKNGNKIVVRGTTKTGAIYSDETKVRQILLNLLSNSAKYTHNGTITIEANRIETPDDSIFFRITDTGIGMTAEDLEMSFDSFYQIKQHPNAKQVSGTGLGLTLCKRFCDLLGGSITAESTPGEGSVFEVRLPTSETKTATPS